MKIILGGWYFRFPRIILVNNLVFGYYIFCYLSTSTRAESSRVLRISMEMSVTYLREDIGLKETSILLFLIMCM